MGLDKYTPIPIGNQVPTHSTEAEMSVLGGILIDNKAYLNVADILSPNMFYAAKHQILYATMVSMYDNNIPVDIVTLAEELLKNSQLDIVGSAYYLMQISDSTPTSANIRQHATIIADRFYKREIARINYALYEMSCSDEHDSIEVIDKMQEELDVITNSINNKNSNNSMPIAHIKILSEYLDNITNGTIKGLMTQFRGINKCIGGFMPGDYVVIAARPSVGKTSLILSWFDYWATTEKRPVLFISIDSMTLNIMFRLVAMNTGIPVGRIRIGSLSSEEQHTILAEFGLKHSGSPFYINDSVRYMREIKTIIRQASERWGIQAFAIDYLQRIVGDNKNNRNMELDVISGEIKAIAKEMKIPAFILCQLNRNLEARQDKRPMLSDLRDSGSIEQDADIVMLLYKPEDYDIFTDDKGTDLRGIVEVDIAKGRDTGKGTVRLKFHGDLTLFYDDDTNTNYTHFQDTENKDDIF